MTKIVPCNLTRQFLALTRLPCCSNVLNLHGRHRQIIPTKVERVSLKSSVGANILQSREISLLSKTLSAVPSEPEKRDRIVTIPNLLCVGRIAAAPYLVYLISANEFNWAIGIFCGAAVSDLLDGYIARKVPGQASMLGSFLDPLADKILVTALYLSLTSVDLIPSALTALVVSRDVLLVYAGLYIRYMGVVPPFTFKKYFDVSLPTAQVQPTTISKINTGIQLVTVASAITAPVIGFVGHPAFYALCAVTATTTIASSLSYAFQKNTYRFEHRSYDHQSSKKLTALAIFLIFNAGYTYHQYA